MQRKIYENLLDWKNSEDKMPLMVLGVRQCGKTYIIREFCKSEYKNFVELNLFYRSDIVELYDSNRTSDEKYSVLQLMLDIDLEDENTILFVDEIQESEGFIQDLKYLCEKHNNVNIIVAGSLLGVKLGRLKKSFPVGKVKLLNMYPMDFEEFLIAINKERFIGVIKEHYENNTSIDEIIHNELMSLYRIYLYIGGMPKNLDSFIQSNCDYVKFKNDILNDIIEEYLNDIRKHTESKSEALKVEETYVSVPRQLANESNKFQYSKIRKGGRYSDYDTSIDWLKDAGLVNISKRVSAPSIPLEGFATNDIFKLFISDVGVLNTMLKIKPVDIINDNLSLYKGGITENFVANHFVYNKLPLYYWQSDGIAEMDFLLYTNDGIIPVEVKSSDNTKSKSLKTYMDKFNPKYAIRISSKNFGYDARNHIKSIPLYAVFCIKD